MLLKNNGSSQETNLEIEGADDNEVEVSAQRIQNVYIAAVTSIDHYTILVLIVTQKWKTQFLYLY